MKSNILRAIKWGIAGYKGERIPELEPFICGDKIPLIEYPDDTSHDNCPPMDWGSIGEIDMSNPPSIIDERSNLDYITGWQWDFRFRYKEKVLKSEEGHVFPYSTQVAVVVNGRTIQFKPKPIWGNR